MELWHEDLMVLEGCNSARDTAPKQEEQERMTWIAIHPLLPISCKQCLLEAELSQHSGGQGKEEEASQGGELLEKNTSAEDLCQGVL